MRRKGTLTAPVEFKAGKFWLNFRTNPRTGVDVGYKERDANYAIAGDRHDFWELLYVDKGLVRICLDETPFTVFQGEFVIIAPNQLHAVTPSVTVAPFYITAHFETNLEDLHGLIDNVIKIDEETRSLLIGLLKEKAKTEFGSYELARCYLAEFLLKAARHRSGQARDKGVTTYYQTNARRQASQEAIDYMESNLSQQLDLQSISRAVGVSASHLEHTFRIVTGQSVISYLQDLRVQQAKRLLLESDLNVTEIAAQCGYSSIHLFSRRFKKLVSVCPSEFARMVRSAVPAENSKRQNKSKSSQRLRKPS